MLDDLYGSINCYSCQRFNQLPLFVLIRVGKVGSIKTKTVTKAYKR